MKTPAAKFGAKVEITDTVPVQHILRFPKTKVSRFEFKGNLRRVVCTLNGIETYNCALFPSKDDYFITLSKQRRTKLGIDVGDVVNIELEKDKSKYGMVMPEEFAEVLRHDADGKRLFEELSPGNQRLMLKLIVFVKDVDKRIAKALTGIELLKQTDGVFDHSEQQAAMRLVSSANPPVKL
ncbi:MAG: YdeI/OmpD-associated family protein [Pyrinomonadaceae bacterium]